MTRSDDDKIQIQQATDLVQLVGEQVALKPKGREFVGLCPFHDDSKPSMYVSPQKQIYKCFACGAGGDVFTFAMQYHKMSFPEALEHLAQRAGIELRPRGGGPRHETGPSDRQRIADANDKAQRFFRNILNHPEHGTAGRDYLAARGVSDEMVKDFALGLAPDRWDGLVKTLATKGWATGDFVLAGLISRRRSRDHAAPDPGARNPDPAACYDRFRHRLIFPIHDALGRPIAFGGRVLPDPQETRDDPTRDAKYLNSAESALFDKSSTLYGLHLAKKAIIDTKTAVIVEGYTDVIACHQAGFRNVVATLGTSLTQGHARELRRYAETVALVFDADEAGQKAADRAVEVFLTGELDVKIVVLPEGRDPADLLGDEDGAERWDAAIQAGSDALTYRMSRLRGSLDAAASLTARQHGIEQAVDDLVRLGLASTNPVRRSLVIQRLAGVVHMKEDALTELVHQRQKAVRRRPAVRSDGASPVGGADGAERGDPRGGTTEDQPAENVAEAHDGRTLAGIARAERQFVACLVRDPGLFDQGLPDGRPIDEELTPADLATPDARRLYDLVYHRLTEADPAPETPDDPGRPGTPGTPALTLAGLIAELNADGHDRAVRTLTTADAELDHALGGRDDRLTEVFEGAVHRLWRLICERRYRQEKQAWLAQNPDAAPTQPHDPDFQRLIEARRHQRSNPTAVLRKPATR